MNLDLYFVPILALALRGADRGESLEKAFGAIERLGQEPGYEEGYGNFCRFMAEIWAHRQLLDEHDRRMAGLELATGAPIEAEERESLLSKLAEAAPWLMDEYEALCQACKPRSRALTLQLLRDGRQIAELTFEPARGRRLVDDICPGHHALRLDTGLVLWEGTLATVDLVWTEAFKGEGLALAAEAGQVHRRPSGEERIPDTKLVLRIFPGIESGSIGIELTP